MFNMVFGFIVVVLSGGAIVLLLLALLYRKMKFARSFFLVLASVFIVVPLLMFLSINLGNSRMKKTFVGTYEFVDHCAGKTKLTLFNDDTFVLVAQRWKGRYEGRWDCEVGDMGPYINFISSQGYLSQAASTERGVGFYNSVQLGECDVSDLELIRVGPGSVLNQQ